ncbi:MAG TPA: Amuc_1100 family pilus-like protein [Chthoniobacterales bacterium]
MSWFQQNRFLGSFLIGLGVATLAALFFVWSAKGGFEEARARFDENAAELDRLQRLTPFPSDANLRKMKTQADDYGAELNRLKEELKTRVLPVAPMAPNEFQSRLRQAITSLGEKARANRVKLPDNFFLGFEEFASALPDTAAAPLLGQQLAQAELLLNILIDARIEALTSFRRVPAAELAAAAPTPPAAAAAAAARRPTPAASPGPQLIERSTVEASFISSPGAARRALTHRAAVPQQFSVLRTLHVLNEKDKGPARDAAGASGSAAAPAAAASPAPGANSALNFIVGNERVQTSARIEMLKFNL